MADGSGLPRSAGLYMMRRRLACYVDIGPLKDDAAAIEETKRRLAVLIKSVVELIDGAKISPGLERDRT